MENPLIRKAEKVHKKIDLLPPIFYEGRELNVGLFGPSTHEGNIDSMQKRYFHSFSLPDISFRPATSRESLAIVSQYPNFAQSGLFRDVGVCLEFVITDQNGIFLSLPLDSKGELITDLDFLNRRISTSSRKENGVYFSEPDSEGKRVVFVPYDSFKTGCQTNEEFVRGGLVRALENSFGDNRTSQYFNKICSEEFYPEGVVVQNGFLDSINNPSLKVLSINSHLGFNFKAFNVLIQEDKYLRASFGIVA